MGRERTLDRRTLLGGIGLGVGAALAGCGEPGEDGGDGEEGEDGDDGGNGEEEDDGGDGEGGYGG